ncbi:glycosyltransferase family 4 protein [Terriglobus roseus]|uniref:Glycosyltransferase involved in cell wall bisynthesis n=1 Tax=Terriglobus roseus TaxID=392734 RepID=A0A1G7KJZ2_9BACT|nr:glycosyltransferase family 1 protein [Terriglobus roseus]SDF37456.1 Glycosyltransferase involved in cell wall bisynthesis [Terriglobus roseus]
MRVVVPVVSSANTMSGVTRHAINMVRALLLTERVDHVHVVAGQWQKYVAEALGDVPGLSLEMLKIHSDIVSRNLWYAVGLPRVVRQENADLVHYSFPSPLWRSAMDAPAVVTLHDLYPHDLPENFGPIKAPFNRIVLRQCLWAADAIACVSHSTLARLERIDPMLSLRSAHVIPNCVEVPDAEVKPLEGLSDPFVLCVAQHRRNKNLLVLLRSFVHLRAMASVDQNLRLLIVGMDGPETNAIKSFIEQHHLQEKVLLKSGLSEGELRWCYRECLALVAPSVVEGFGLPVAEALLEGCRVVCSDIPSFREVGKHHCRYVRLNDCADVGFANAIVEECVRPKPLAVMSPQYSLETIACQYEELYRSLVVRNSSSVPVGCSTAKHVKGHVEV